MQDVTWWENTGPQGWILKALREAGGSLASELYSLGEAGFIPAGADVPSVAQTIAHLVEAERLAQEQITAVVEGHPGLLPLRDVEAPLADDAPDPDPAAGLARFEALRARTLRLLSRLTEDEWQRPGRHAYRGQVTPAEIARDLAHHDLEHLWQVRRLKARGDV